jgi:hypothetical protein
MNRCHTDAVGAQPELQPMLTMSQPSGDKVPTVFFAVHAKLISRLRFVRGWPDVCTCGRMQPLRIEGFERCVRGRLGAPCGQVSVEQLVSFAFVAHAPRVGTPLGIPTPKTHPNLSELGVPGAQTRVCGVLARVHKCVLESSQISNSNGASKRPR